MIPTLLEKMFFSQCYFTIALRHRNAQSILDSTTFRAEYVMPADSSDWYADPFLVDDHGKTYLFYEAVRGTKGRIEVAEVNSDCSLSNRTVIFEDENHYSYPFVFRYNENWYMIPETSSQKNIQLYRCDAFPYEWTKVSTFVSESRAVDTTVFEADGSLYMLTYIADEITECVTPKAYRLYMDGDVKLEAISWNDYNPLRVRGAGSIFEKDGILYRPAQNNREMTYGNGVIFYKIVPPGDCYREVMCTELNPGDLKARKCYVNGLHTYAVSDYYEAIDIRCRKLDLLKPFRRIIRWIKKPNRI